MFDYLPLDNANFFIKISNLFFFTPPYCIVLYRIYTFNNYIALFAANTNQKRFQCERPRGKRAVLRELKEALYSPVNNVDRVIPASRHLHHIFEGKNSIHHVQIYFSDIFQVSMKF